MSTSQNTGGMTKYRVLLGVILMSIGVAVGAGSPALDENPRVLPFGEAGKIKMLYDCRQRPQSVYLKERLYIVYNGDAKPTSNNKGSAYPMIITYDPENRSFSKPERLHRKSSSDHHYSPIIWADEDDYLHVLFGCHRTPGTHLISKHPVQK